MIDPSNSSPDPLLTLAEIAAELRVNPATVRSWVSRGHLKAFRAGQRKWVVRRSELNRMIDASNSSAGSATRESGQASAPPPRRPLPARGDTSSTEVAGPQGRVVNGRDAAELLRIARQNLADAFTASRCAPPARGYLDRLRAIADGLEHTASALRNAGAVVGMRWQPPSSFGWNDLPYELRPDGNRPDEPELWEKFDAAVERLSITLSGTDVRAVADGHAELRDTLLDVADQLEGDDSRQEAIWAG